MVEKQELQSLLEKGLSYQKIGDILGYSKSNIKYFANKYELNNFSRYQKPVYKINYFDKIDTKQKAYILGFLLGDSNLSDKLLECSIALKDKEILDFISQETGCNIQTYKQINKKQKRFPRARISIGNKNYIVNLKKLFGGNLKKDRHIPIIKQDLEKYMLLGFFDAEGSISYGVRKDRGGIWQKVAFTSQLKMLEGIQNILIKQGISSKIRPKTNEDCYVLEFSNKKMVAKFIDYLYPNYPFVILKRKYTKAYALRLELGEFGET